jgi:PPOX class probable F420-dependent enzyme
VTGDDARSRFLEARIARLATVDGMGHPHVVPIVFAVEGNTIYSAVDSKPKRTTALRRLANVEANSNVSVLVDYYDDSDWDALWWARADGAGRVLDAATAEGSTAVSCLTRRYPQHERTPPVGPVLAIDVERWSGWSAQ